MADKREIPKYVYNQKDNDGKVLKPKWWAQPDEEMHVHVFGVVKAIREAQSYRSLMNLKFARLYNNMEILGLQAGLFARVADPTAFISNALAYNVIQSTIDTAASKLASKKPRPLYLTDGADWNTSRRAEFQTGFMEGLFDTMGTGLGDNRSLYGMSRRGFVDSSVFGTGVVKFFKEGNTVKAERVITEEVVVDETEGMYELPRQMHQEKLVVREVMADLFPKHADTIMAAPSGLPANVKDQGDMIKVVESWHLKSGEESKDGKKFLGIDNCTLDVSDWAKDYFPFLFQRWNPRILGFYGQGLAEQLCGIQLEINKRLRTAQIAEHLVAVPRVWLSIANKAGGATLSNEIGGKHYYVGERPIFETPIGMSPQFYAQIENLFEKAYRIAGISELSANAAKPAGLDSKVALREYQDIESERFQLVGLRYQDFHMDAARISMDMLNDLDDEGKNPAARVKTSYGSKAMRWKDVRMDPEDYQSRPFPTDILPSQPAGKLSKVQELVQAGFFDKDEALELLDYPDIKRATQIKLAPRNDIKRMVARMVDDDEYESPEPYMNLEFGKTYAQSVYLLGRSQNMPEEKLELLRRFMDDCQALVERAQAAAAPMAPGVPGAPPTPGADPTVARPDLQPRSDLLPVGA